MGKVYLLDCTLRDGGYINNWEFGYKAITAIIQKLEQTGIEMIEVGFLKGDIYNPDQSLFPDINTIKKVLPHKVDGIRYVAMLDMSAPIPLERITANQGDSVDGIRVIFKKNKINEAYDACKYIRSQGYEIFVNFVNTDAYTDREFIDGLEKFNALNPTGVTIVDTFGMIKRKHFKRLLAIADNNLCDDTMLCYHAHNNLQQAYGNAEAMVEMNLKREIVIDACVFGMGRGAGNLNLELFAEFLNEEYGKKYKITPMLEIMDEYLSVIYKTKFWGYSLPLYLSAIHGCHPNYAIYWAEKNALSEKAFNELLCSISNDDRFIFSKAKADAYYKKFMESFYDDTVSIATLTRDFQGKKKILLLAPGSTLSANKTEIQNLIDDETIVICVNFHDVNFSPSYVFIGNIRRFNKIIQEHQCKIIATSNIPDYQKADYPINFSSLIGANNEVFDNSGLMALRLLERLGVKEVSIAGMDGFSEMETGNYYANGFVVYHHAGRITSKNKLVSDELKKISKYLKMNFITPTNYQL